MPTTKEVYKMSISEHKKLAENLADSRDADSTFIHEQLARKYQEIQNRIMVICTVLIVIMTVVITIATVVNIFIACQCLPK
jgi:hypothetical protein